MNSSLGERIASARRQKDSSTNELARRLGVKRETIENWEAGKSEPRPNKLMQLAGLLDVSLVWLMSGEAGEAEGRVYDFDRMSGLKRKLERAQSLQGEVMRLLGELDSEIAELKADSNRAA